MIRVLIAEDHQLLREGLEALLSGEPDIRVIAQVQDGHDAVARSEDLGPEVVLMDVGLPGLNGIDATRQLAQARPDIRVLILTMHDDVSTVDRALRAGARGFLVKGCRSDEMCEAIRTVARGEVYLHPSISSFVLHGYLQGDPQGEQADPLSPREREILQLIAEGNTSAEIAARLGLKTKTIQNYRVTIMDKLDVRTTAGLVRYALRIGLAQ